MLHFDIMRKQTKLIIYSIHVYTDTYDHRLLRTGHPVRSAILKQQIGRSVVGWVTTSESLLLYVSHCFVFGGCVDRGYGAVVE